MRKIIGAFVVALALGACAISGPSQSNAAAIAETGYIAADRLALVYLNSGKATPAAAAQIGKLDAQAYEALVAVRKAVAEGNSTAVDVLLLQKATATLVAYLSAQGAQP